MARFEHNTEENIVSLYKIHDKLTDKKLLRTITVEEEKLLEKIRNEIESHNGDRDLTNLYEDRINKYKELLTEIERIEKLLEKNGNQNAKMQNM